MQYKSRDFASDPCHTLATLHSFASKFSQSTSGVLTRRDDCSSLCRKLDSLPRLVCVGWSFRPPLHLLITSRAAPPLLAITCSTSLTFLP
jgi:hypothetical protein